MVEKFKPSEHFRNLKGQQYLEVKWRVVWFREEHPDGYISTEMVEHDAATGLAVFKARAGYITADHADAHGMGYGSETRKDFGDYLEKAETKAVGRALAMLGYGTAQALDLDEGERLVVDSPVDPPARPSRPLALRPAPAATATAPAPSADLEAMRTVLVGLCEADEPGRDAIRQKEPGGLDSIPDARVAAWVQWMRGRAESGQAGKPVKAKGGS